MDVVLRFGYEPLRGFIETIGAATFIVPSLVNGQAIIHMEIDPSKMMELYQGAHADLIRTRR